MAGVPAGLPAGVRVTDHISLGVIARAFPPDRVQQVLAETGKASERERDLPAHVMVYYAIAMALYMGSSTREVLRCLLEGLRWLWGSDAVKVAGKSGISQARSRLGETPLRRLYSAEAQDHQPGRLRRGPAPAREPLCHWLGFLGSTAMAGVPAGFPAGVRVGDPISLGVIAKTFPPDRAQIALRFR